MYGERDGEGGSDGEMVMADGYESEGDGECGDGDGQTSSGQVGRACREEASFDGDGDGDGDRK